MPCPSAQGKWYRDLRKFLADTSPVGRMRTVRLDEWRAPETSAQAVEQLPKRAD